MLTAVRITSTVPASVWAGQTSSSSSRWKDIQLVGGAGDDDGDADWLVAYSAPGPSTLTRVPKERRIIFIIEPPDIMIHYGHFLNQFGIVVSPVSHKGFNGIWIKNQTAHWWFIGRTYDQLQSENYEEKSFDLSVVCSNARKFDDQRRRFEFVSALKDIFKDRLHWYGRGIKEIKTKAEAVIPYKYSIAIENNTIEHFWTEKIADVFLGSAFPFYWGGPNLTQYFPAGSFEYLNPSDPQDSAKQIERAIEAGRWEERLPLIREARQRVLNEYNLLNEIWKVIQQYGSAARDISRLSKPQPIFGRNSGLRSWALGLPRRAKRLYARRKLPY